MRKSLGTILSVLLLGLVAVAGTTTATSIEQYSFSIFVPCANAGQGEVIDMSGQLRTLVSLTFNSDGSEDGFFKFQPVGVVGQGETTGHRYLGVGVTLETVKNFFPFPQSGDGVFNYVNNFLLVGQGTAENFLVHQNTKFAISQDGNLLHIQNDNFHLDCK